MKVKIVSRLSTEEYELQRLRDILEAATNGSIAEGSTLEPATDLHGLVDQVDITCMSLLDTLETTDRHLAVLVSECHTMNLMIDKLERRLAQFESGAVDGIDYDDDLDHATSDMMEALVASGASEPTFDGELTFSSDIVISKEDFKPIVRQAIESWLRLKVR